MISSFFTPLDTRRAVKTPLFSGLDDEKTQISHRKRSGKSHSSKVEKEKKAELFEEGDEFFPERTSIQEDSDSEQPVIIKPPTKEELAKWEEERKKAELMAIGERFAGPGRLLIELENQSKALSRSVAHKTRELATSATNTACDKTVSVLKATTKAIEDWQNSR